jgi:Leucine-rich repeat (LRR) protein
MKSPAEQPITSCLTALLLAAAVPGAAQADLTAKYKPQVNPDFKDLPDNSWKRVQPSGDAFNHPKTEVGLVYDEKTGTCVYFGGCSAGYCNNVWVYHAGSNTWKEVLPWIKGREEKTGKPIGQCGYCATYSSDLGLYFKHRGCSSTADGRGGRGRDSNSWTLDVGKLTWERVASGAHDGGSSSWPAAFCCYGLVYDRVAKVAILYGGLEEDRGTWAFDFQKKKWHNLKPKTSPSPLFLHSMVYDSANRVTLLFGGQTGGYDSGKTLNETWAYHHASNTWEKRHPRHSPPPRAQAQACYDSVNGVMILFGGHANVYPRRTEGRFYTDTWVYDYKADTWTEMKPKVYPPGSALRFMAFDPVNNVAVNVTGDSAKKQTWVYRYQEQLKTKPADVAILKELLATAASYKRTREQEVNDRFQKDLAALINKIADPKLRAPMQRILPDLEKAALLHAQVRQVQADVKAVKGLSATTIGGPGWLRRLVGDKPMSLFDKLTDIDLYDRAIPIKSGFRSRQITDNWLHRLAGLPDLRYLDISVTVVVGPGLRHVGKLKNLESLNLTLTGVTDPQLGQFRGLSNLRKLLLASTKCKGRGFKDLATLTNLENLNLHYTPVHDAGLKEISRLTSLQRLEIVHTHFTDKGATYLAQLTNMRRLQMGSREATGAAVAPLRAMKNLRELDLHDGQATTEGVKYAAQIPSLTVLRLYAGPVKDEGLRHVAQLANLEILVAQSIQITDAGLDHLRALKKLKRLDIQGNNIGTAAITGLKKALPTLEIVR